MLKNLILNKSALRETKKKSITIQKYSPSASRSRSPTTAGGGRWWARTADRCVGFRPDLQVQGSGRWNLTITNDCRLSEWAWLETNVKKLHQVWWSHFFDCLVINFNNYQRPPTTGCRSEQVGNKCEKSPPGVMVFLLWSRFLSFLGFLCRKSRKKSKKSKKLKKSKISKKSKIPGS